MHRKAPLWHAAPFLRLLPPLVAGILVADRWQPAGYWWWGGLLVVAPGLAWLAWRPSTLAYRHRWLGGLLVHLLLVAVGGAVWHAAAWPLRPAWMGRYLDEAVAFVGAPETLPQPGAKNDKLVFSLERMILPDGRSERVCGKILAYFPRDRPLPPAPGERWLLAARPVQRIRTQQLPGGFDFAAWAGRQQLYHQAFYQGHQLRRLAPAPRLSLSAWLARCRQSALAAMRRYIDPAAQGIAMALLIGYRKEIDPALLQAYTETGVVHVIAVSGMHLGLLYLLLRQLIRIPVRPSRNGWPRALLVALIIWWFSAVAGGAPSIFRAAWMFSFALAAGLLRRPLNRYQSLSGTAFAMCCIDPCWIWDAGCQLSFAALAGIFLYQRPISGWLSPQHPFLKQVWELVSVTLAAQVLTLPISIGMFHQAPVYFLAANLAAVPLSSLALVTALLHWLFTALSLPLPWMGWLTGLLIHWMNAAIRRVQSLPGSVLGDLEWSVVQVVLAYAVIACLSGWLLYKKKALFPLALLALLAFTGEELRLDRKAGTQNSLLLYTVKESPAMDFVIGRTFYQNGEAPGLQPVRRQLARALRCKRLVSLPTVARAYEQPLRLFRVQSDRALQWALQQQPALVLLSRGVRDLPLPPALEKPCLLVADATVPAALSQHWSQRRFPPGIRFLSLRETGPLLISIDTVLLIPIDNKRTFAPP